MSNHLAIAATTSTFSQLLEKAAGIIAGGKVTVGRPKEGAAPGINLYLYQVSVNPALRNIDLPARRPERTLARRPQAALDLHYLLSFYGTESKFEPQIIMGSAISLLHSRPLLTREMIRAEIERCIAEDPAHYLATADLADEIESIRFTPLSLSLEDLSKLWSIFFQIPYTLSLAYKASAVLIEAEETAQETLPVREALVYAVTFRHPIVEEVRVKDDKHKPVMPDSIIQVMGRQLRGEITRVRLGEAEVTLTAGDAANTVSDTVIELSLGSALFTGQPVRAGVLGLQVLHPVVMGKPGEEHSGFESNVKPLVLHPVVTVLSVSSTELKLGFQPKVARRQRVVVLLNEYPPVSKPPRGYTLKAPLNNGIADDTILDTDAVTFSLDRVKPGTYLWRAQVDGAPSAMRTGPDPADPKYIGPTVDVP